LRSRLKREQEYAFAESYIVVVQIEDTTSNSIYRREMSDMRKYAALLAIAAMLALATMGGVAVAAPKEQLNLTVYNSNLALVSMVKQMEIPIGEGEVIFPNVPSMILANTVLFESLSFPSKVWVREQNYEYDLVNEYKLLQKIQEKFKAFL
jgi:hypothetical protein